MDATYVGKYGQLRALGVEFIGNALMEQLMQKNASEFLGMLSKTSYRADIDLLSNRYKVPDLVEAVLNSHMMRSIRYAYSAIPPLAKDVIDAYISKWDVENIKIILSAKKLGYGVDRTDEFLTVHGNIPVGIFGGAISREDYKNIMEQKDMEGVINSIVKFGYGASLLRYVDEVKKSGDISSILLQLDILYYERILKAFRFYNGDEGLMIEYIRDMIDIRNAMVVIKSIAFGIKADKSAFIAGGNIADSKLADMASKGIDDIKQDLPFKIDWAFEAYKKDPFVTYFEVAMKRELYSKYLKAFEGAALSLDYIVYFIIRCELERDELRNIWLNRYYNIGIERTENMMVLKHVT